VDSISYKTVVAKKETMTKEWLVVDATDMPLGRLTSQVAKLIRGKHKAIFTPHVDCGDHVIVINAEKVKFTGNKLSEKQYVRYTGYPGGQRFATPTEVLAKHPARVIELAVKGMLPKTRLGRAQFNNVHVVAGANHKYQAQNPKAINLNDIF